MTTLTSLAQLPAGKWLCFSHDPGNAQYHYWQVSTKSGLWFVPLTEYCADGMISPAKGDG